MSVDLYKDLKAEYTETDNFQFIEKDDLTEIEEPKTFNSISNDDDILQMYLKDIGKIRLLNSKEEKALGKTIKEGKPAIGHMPEQFSDFEETVKFVASLDSGVMSIAHPARSKAYCPEFYEYLFSNSKNAGGEKAMFYEGYYQSYEGEYFQKWQSIIDNAANKYGLLKTGGLDSHGKNLVYRTKRKV